MKKNLVATTTAALLLAACGQSDPGNPVALPEPAAATPRAVCGPGSMPETGIQGRGLCA
ncbi:MAG TPA: hypothetical protein VM369_01650 [Candidatus Binatia bacterium]|nr:hypothetical protein [Candidatus Binatia bacterium]